MLLDAYSSSSKSLLFDGFPRTINQADALQVSLPITAVVVLDIPHETIISRLSQRWVHLPSGRTYAYDYNPPKTHGLDDITSEPLVQRDDDKPETIAKRLHAYENMTKPIIEHYKQMSLSTQNLKIKIFQGTESNVIYPEVKEFLMNDVHLQVK
jgi:nucleoside-triphosphate--adenylate kinase